MLTRIYRSTICLVAVVALLGTVAGCAQDGDSMSTAMDPGASAPALPSVETMTMDLSFFQQAGVDMVSIEKGEPTAELAAANTGKDNFINAAVRTFYVQLVLYVSLEAPIGAFAAAIHAVPQPQPDGSYLWTFIFVDEGIEYSIFLYGIQVGNRVEWRMEVSSNDPEMPLDHFVWFDGESMIDESGGYWQFYLPVGESDGIPVVRIDWDNLPGDAHRLTIVNNQVGGEEEGDMLVINDAPAAASIDYHDASAQEDHNITWYADGSGSLTVPDYNNGDQACWDTRQRDVACPTL